MWAWALLVTIVIPLATGLSLVRGLAPSPDKRLALVPSTLLCALAFNLVFFWQELWLVAPKALTPGLMPTLYHNDHDWRGSAPIAELLQGTGAIGTALAGLCALGLLGIVREDRPGLRLLLFWLAFQGLFQALSQLALGSMVPGNDVGRALAYLGLPIAGRIPLLLLAVAAMAGVGVILARRFPIPPQRGTRAFAATLAVATLVSVAIIVPFRVPREPIEVVLIPLIVNLTGLAWCLLGASAARSQPGPTRIAAGTSWTAAAALGTLLLFFQLVLRPGIAF